MTMKRLALLMMALLLMTVSAMAENTLDLTGRGEIGEHQVRALITELSEAPAGTQVEMVGVKLSLKAKAQLATALPQLFFHWEVELGDRVIDSTATTLDLDGQAKRANLTAFTNALSALPRLTEVTMHDYTFSTREMEKLMAEHPDIHFNWTITLNNYRIRTDVTAFSTAKGRQEPRYTASMLYPLQYCPDLLALDVGHNNVSDLSFLTQWPKLRRLIVIDSRKPVTDISPLAELDDLEYVELFMQNITDLTPLAGKTKLLDLNLCYNDVTDLTPLYSCTSLERLWISHNYHLSKEQIEAFKEAVPGCQVETETVKSTEAGWREHPRYFVMKESFDTRTYIPFEETK